MVTKQTKKGSSMKNEKGTEEEHEAMRNASKPGTIRVEAILDGYCDCGKKTEADFSAGMCYKCKKGLRS